jgi:RNA-binding protein Musashi
MTNRSVVPLVLLWLFYPPLSAVQIEVKTAQPRSQRDQQRNNPTSQNSGFSNGQVAAGNTAAMSTGMPFMTMNNAGAGDMSMMYQRMMNGMGTPYGAMMGGGMGMMGGFNPMMGMGMGMGRFGMGGMAGMTGGGGAVGGMNPMAAAGAGNMSGNMGMGGAVGGMRLGMGPIGMTGQGAAGMGAMVPGGMGAAAAMGGGGMAAMGMRQNMGMMGATAAGAGRGGRPGMNQGPGPARITNRGQHGFHPYAR